MLPRLIGMVHLGPLPGAPRFGGDLEAVIAAGRSDAVALAAAGFNGVLVENFGDAPFYADDVPKVTVAAMTRAVAEVRAAVSIPVGVNVLRNDGVAALSIAAATGAAFMRVNVLSGTMWTDQGAITGRAAEIARMRRALSPDVAILADVFVKHATPPEGLTIEQASRDLAERAGADAVVVSGDGTGRPPTMAALRKVRAAIGEVPLFVGSGVTVGTVARFLSVADGVVAGTALKRRGATSNPIGAKRAREFVTAARDERSRP